MNILTAIIVIGLGILGLILGAVIGGVFGAALLGAIVGVFAGLVLAGCGKTLRSTQD